MLREVSQRDRGGSGVERFRSLTPILQGIRHHTSGYRDAIGPPLGGGTGEGRYIRVLLVDATYGLFIPGSPHPGYL